jgi:hypothetical protein
MNSLVIVLTTNVIGSFAVIFIAIEFTVVIVVKLAGYKTLVLINSKFSFELQGLCQKI